MSDVELFVQNAKELYRWSYSFKLNVVIKDGKQIAKWFNQVVLPMCQMQMQWGRISNKGKYEWLLNIIESFVA